MHILPPLETVKDIAATQQYDVLPLSCKILSDFITPIEAMRILKNVSTHCYMLESAQADDRWGRYTFLGFDPKLEITCIDGKMKAGGLTVRTDDPSQYLRELLSSYRSPPLRLPPLLHRRARGVFFLRLSQIQRAERPLRRAGRGQLQGCRFDAL